MDRNDALKLIAKHCSQDPEYARLWHGHVAMCCYDSLNGTAPWREKVSNAAATRFMKIVLDVDYEQ